MELKNEHLTRQLDVIPLNCLNRQITIIGAGAVGSYSAFALAKMGFNNITIYDFDEVDIVNLNAQIYRFSDIGKSKVEALKDIIKDFTGINLQIKNERYENQVFKDIVIMAVDNMKTRKEIYQNHKMRGIMTNFLIDPRMAIE
jgi:tRNA A37 threonylcarbamoyladenosine dehydratase